jgi:flagellar biosynthesis protein FlhB
MPYTKSEAGELLGKAVKEDKIFRSLDKARKILRLLTLIFFLLLIVDIAVTVYAYLSYVSETDLADASTLAYLFSSGFGASGASYYSLILCLLFSWTSNLFLKGLSEII